jgi:hypothetical protein
VDPVLVVEGGAVGAAAVRFARKRPRRSRVRREPIDLEQIAADFAEPRKRPRHEIIAALEAEVQRVKVRASAVPIVEPAILIPLGPVPADAETEPAPEAAPAAPSAPPEGLPLEQLREWLDQVQTDLEKVQVRIEFLHLEQHRLQDQKQLVAELITSSEPA